MICRATCSGTTAIISLSATSSPVPKNLVTLAQCAGACGAHQAAYPYRHGQSLHADRQMLSGASLRRGAVRECEDGFPQPSRHMIDRRDVAGRRFPEAASDSRSRDRISGFEGVEGLLIQILHRKGDPVRRLLLGAICNKGSSVIWLISVIPIVKLRWLCWGRNSGLTAKSLSASWRRVEMVGAIASARGVGSSAARPGQTAGQQNDLVVFQQKAAGGLADIERVRCWETLPKR